MTWILLLRLRSINSTCLVVAVCMREDTLKTHMQGYIEFTNSVRLSSLQVIVPTHWGNIGEVLAQTLSRTIDIALKMENSILSVHGKLSATGKLGYMELRFRYLMSYALFSWMKEKMFEKLSNCTSAIGKVLMLDFIKFVSYTLDQFDLFNCDAPYYLNGRMKQ